MSEIKKCPTCKRTKNKAISEQISERKRCGVPRGSCFFEKEILKAIETKTKIKVIKKERKEIRVVKK